MVITAGHRTQQTNFFTHRRLPHHRPQRREEQAGQRQVLPLGHPLQPVGPRQLQARRARLDQDQLVVRQLQPPVDRQLAPHLHQVGLSQEVEQNGSETQTRSHVY